MSAILRPFLDAERLADCAQNAQALALSVQRDPLPNIVAGVDLLALIGAYGRANRRTPVPRGGRAEYFDDGDAPSMEPITEEVERLQGAEFVLMEAMHQIISEDPGGYFAAIAQKALKEAA